MDHETRFFGVRIAKNTHLLGIVGGSANVAIVVCRPGAERHISNECEVMIGGGQPNASPFLLLWGLEAMQHQ